MKTNGESAPRICSSRGRSNSAVIWLSTCRPRMVPIRSTTCSSSGCAVRSGRELLLDQPLVVAVGELLVAADRVVLGQRHRVVGVVAVGRAARRHHHPAYPVGQAGVEDVPAAVDVDGVLLLPRRVLAGRHDRGEVHHHLGGGLGDPRVDRGRVGDVHQHVPDAVHLGGGEPQVGADHLVAGLGEPGDHRGAEEPVAAGDQDPHADHRRRTQGCGSATARPSRPRARR